MKGERGKGTYQNKAQENVNRYEQQLFNLCYKVSQEQGSCSWYSDLAVGWMIRGSIPGSAKRVFSSLKYLYQLWGPSSLLFNWQRGSFPGEKWPKREADHSPPSSGDIKNDWSYISMHPTCCYGMHRDYKWANTTERSGNGRLWRKGHLYTLRVAKKL
jgi:hypothetical protein